MTKNEQYLQAPNEGITFPNELFRDYNLVALGESEHGRHYDEIIACLEKFQNEIEAILLEMPLNYQNSIEHFMTTGEVPEDFKALLDGAKREGKNIDGILMLFKKAKELQKRIICYDPPKIPMGLYTQRDEYNYYLQGDSRDEDMATFIKQHISTNPGNYLIIGGADHFEPSQDNSDTSPNLGYTLQKVMGDKFTFIKLPQK